MEPSIPPAAQTSPTIPSQKSALDTMVGSFYGRRDFENRHDLDDAVPDGLIKRQPSMVGAVLERIKSKKRTNGVDSDSYNEDDEEDEDSD